MWYLDPRAPKNPLPPRHANCHPHPHRLVWDAQRSRTLGGAEQPRFVSGSGSGGSAAEAGGWRWLWRSRGGGSMCGDSGGGSGSGGGDGGGDGGGGSDGVGGGATVVATLREGGGDG